MIWDRNEPEDRDKDPKNRKWGCSYFNPRDSRLFVPKKNPKWGSTVNFANPCSFLVFLSPLLLLIIVIIAYAVA